jgi:Flp pilus assembly protein TadG
MKALWNDRSGAAALEMALITTFLLLPLSAGLIGSGQALLTQYRVDRALHAALIYAWTAPTASSAALQSAAQGGYGAGGGTLATSASTACYCIDPTGSRASGTAVLCTGTCTAPQIVGTWVTVNASAVFTPVFPIPWTSAAWTLSATGTVRVQ